MISLTFSNLPRRVSCLWAVSICVAYNRENWRLYFKYAPRIWEPLTLLVTLSICEQWVWLYVKTTHNLEYVQTHPLSLTLWKYCLSQNSSEKEV